MLRRSLLKMFGAAPIAATVSPGVLPASAVASDMGMAGVADSMIRKGVANAVQSGFERELKKSLKNQTKNALLKNLKPRWWLDDLKEDSKRDATRIILANEYAPSDYNFNIMALKSMSPAAKSVMLTNHIHKRKIETDGDWTNFRIQKLLFEQANGLVDEDDY